MRKLVLYIVLLSLITYSKQQKADGTSTPQSDLPDNDNTTVTAVDAPIDIVGGARTSISAHTHQVALITKSSNSLVCGGSIIDSYWILTAAHCCVNKRPSSFRLRAGSSYYSFGGDVYYAAKIIYHANYNAITTDFDICVIKTTRRIEFGAIVQPITMVNEGTEHADGTIAKVTGWGKTSYASSSHQLQEVEVPIVSRTRCRNSYVTEASYITDRQICAGARTGGKDTCQGDSGGPLIINDQLAGVTSWGIGCGEAGYPGIYVNVAFFRRWIKGRTGV